MEPKKRKPARRFTAAEDELIVALYSSETLVVIASKLGRSYQCVQGHIAMLIRKGVLKRSARAYGREWSKQDLEYLSQNWGLVTIAHMRRRLHRSQVAMQLKAKRLGLTKMQNMFTQRAVARMFNVDDKCVRRWIYNGALPARKGAFKIGRNFVWTIRAEDIEHFIRNAPQLYESKEIDRDKYPYWRNLADQFALDGPREGNKPYRRPRRFLENEEIAFIVDNYGHMSAADIGAKLGRSAGSVRSRVDKLRAVGVEVPRQPKGGFDRPRWSASEEEYLRENWGLLPDEEVAYVVGRTAIACEWRAYVMGIRKRENRRRAHEQSPADELKAA